jgi:hypothetical protein
MCRALPSVGGFSEIRDLRSDVVADLQPSTLGMPHRASVADVNTRNVVNHEEYCVDDKVATTSCRGSFISLLHIKETLFMDVRWRPLTLKSQPELGGSGKAQGQAHQQNKGPTRW